MKKLRRSFSMILSLVLLVAMSVTTFAADSVPEVTFDANTELFTYENTDTYTAEDGTEYPDLFTQFKGVIPGDSFTQEITVKAENISGQTVNIYLHSENEQEDYETIIEYVEFAVYCDGEEISAGTLSDGIMLGSFIVDATVDITVEFSIPLEVGNEIAALYGTIEWIFVAELIEDEITDDPTDDSTDDPTDDSTDDSAEEQPETGDGTTTGLWLSLAAVSLAGVGIVYYKRSNKIRN